MPPSFLRNVLAPGGHPTIRRRIITLVLLILLPLLALFGWAALNLATARMAAIEAQHNEIVTEIAGRADQAIAESIGKLIGVALTIDPQSDALGEFRHDLRGLLAQPSFHRIWRFDRDGRTDLSTETSGTPLPGVTLTPDMIRRTFLGEISVSDIFGSDATNARFVIATPTHRDGKPVAGLAAEVSARALDGVLPSVGLADGWIAAIIDRQGTFVSRSVAPEVWIGRKVRAESIAATQANAPAGTYESATREGVPALNSYRRSALTGWTTVVAVPREFVVAPMQKSALLITLVALGALSLTLAAAVGYERRISDPVRHLGSVARAFITGKPVAKPAFTLAELEEVQQALDTAAGESAHLAALVASSGDAIMSMDLDGVIKTWNPAAEQLFGYKAEEIIGKPKALLVPPHAMADYRRQQATVASGGNVRSETIRMHKNGSPISVSVDAAPIRRPDGRIIATSSILHDITERIASEEHRQFLMREIAHRSKNQLAIIQSIASQTARSSGSKQEFLEQFKNRLQGLSASHDLLLKQDWRGAPLDDLVRRQVETFVGDRSTAMSIEGPSAILTAAAAEAIGLALHELATNSAKYGALSVPTGKVDVAWKRLLDGGEEKWQLSWREHNGPPVVPPQSTGFGTQVIKRMVAMAVNGETELDYAADGLVWKLTFPAAAMKLIEPELEVH